LNWQKFFICYIWTLNLFEAARQFKFDPSWVRWASISWLRNSFSKFSMTITNWTNDNVHRLAPTGSSDKFAQLSKLFLFNLVFLTRSLACHFWVKTWNIQALQPAAYLLNKVLLVFRNNTIWDNYKWQKNECREVNLIPKNLTWNLPSIENYCCFLRPQNLNQVLVKMYSLSPSQVSTF